MTTNKKNTEISNKEKTNNAGFYAKNRKYILIIVLAIVLLISLSLYKNLVEKVNKTKINTPVISRTELNKKPSIEIKLYEEGEETEVKEFNKKPETKIDDSINPIVSNLTNVELKQKQLEEKMDNVVKASNADKIAEINTKIAKIESLNGNIGNLSKIFLGQQLVLLDNAFKVGGNQNLAISNIYNFAKNVAKNNEVALKLQELLNITEQQAIITPAALNFYASELKHLKLASMHIQKQQAADDASVIDRIKAFLKSFILVKKQNEITEDQKYWNVNINKLQEAIIFGNFVEVEKILNDEKLMTLGAEDFKNFNQLFKTYLNQQQTLQAILGAFIKGYNYDY